MDDAQFLTHDALTAVPAHEFLIEKIRRRLVVISHYPLEVNG